MLPLRELRPQTAPISQMNLLEHFFFRQEWQLSFKFLVSKAVHSLPINFQPIPIFCSIPIPTKKRENLFITLLTISFTSGCKNTTTQSLTKKVISTFLRLENLQLLNPAVWKMAVLISYMHVSKFLHAQRQTFPSQFRTQFSITFSWLPAAVWVF